MKPIKALAEKFILNFLAVFVGIQLAKHWLDLGRWDFTHFTLMTCLMAAIAVTIVDVWRYWKSI
ncbi:hypothetical protein [Novosphingobium sp. BW1]|uniref:hypothetical protein n=1 Tax=Novosphingobium sp. BW1 TaxID=2592621 RepID=UPI0011DED98A|nr:hypothetical protein [Novosphingobium sp. BW1]TYC92807.1 hypothetical protein FMM79_02025 [Novosphingobium sp. BW1]